MKLKTAVIAVAAASAAALGGCGGGHNQASVQPPPPSPGGVGLVTSQVLDQARQPSEIAEPYPINDGAIVLTDTSETSDPLSIDGP